MEKNLQKYLFLPRFFFFGGGGGGVYHEETWWYLGVTKYCGTFMW